MSVPAFRCAVQAELRGDSMLGTAWPYTKVLLIHQPGPWGPRGLLESRCDPGVARRIDVAAASAGMRLQAIRRPGKHEVGTPAGGFWVGVADVRAGAVTWWRTDDLAEVALELEAGRELRQPVMVDTAPLFLVCTHGRHDACCALRGRPLSHALQRARPGRVWETTHLGGDRFAANLLVLPSGELYGRVLPLAAGELAERVDAGEVLPGLMRGRIGMSPIAQAGLVFAHQHLGIAARTALSVTAVRRIDASLAEVSLQTPVGSVAVTVEIETAAPTQLTCRGPLGARARVYRGVAMTRVTTVSAPS
jgi:hypothetical protein